MKVFKELLPSLYKTWKLRHMNWEQLTQNKVLEVPVVVSLTTFGNRLQKVDIALRSILNQTYWPSQIVLNIHQSYQNQLPPRLAELLSDRVQINWTTLDCPHIKLVPTIQNFPDMPIITVDDDVIYPNNLIEKLFEAHQQNPNLIISNHVRVIQTDEEGRFKSYKYWKFDGVTDNPKRYLALGFGGVLYPSHIFDEEVFNEKQMMCLSPKADDLWFKAMELRNNVQVTPLIHKPDNLYPIAGTQQISLKANNVDEDGNTKQWKALVDCYDLVF